MDIKKIIGLGAIACLSLYLFLAVPIVQAVLYFQYHIATTAEGWTAGTDDSRHVRPLGEKFDFLERERIQFFGQAGPIDRQHQWSIKIYQNDSLTRELVDNWQYPDTIAGWTYTNYIPTLSDLPVGSYRADFFVNLGYSAEKLGSVYFNVRPQGWPYYSSNVQNYNQAEDFNHRYKTELYLDGTKISEATTGWQTMPTGASYSGYAANRFELRSYIDTGYGFRRIDNSSADDYWPPSDSQNYGYVGSALAHGWRYGSGANYWDLAPVDQSSTFSRGETVHLIAKARNISVDHQWLSELYKDGQLIWSDVSSWRYPSGTWAYGAYYPSYGNPQPGNYEWRVSLRRGNDTVLLDRKPFIVQAGGSDYTYVGATVAENWTHGSGDSFWNIQPVSPRTSFDRGQNVFVVAQARDVHVDHRWRVETYRNGSLLWSHTTDWNRVGRGWDFSNFYPANYNSAFGNYEFRIYFDDGSGFKKLDSKSFKIH